MRKILVGVFIIFTLSATTVATSASAQVTTAIEILRNSPEGVIFEKFGISRSLSASEILDCIGTLSPTERDSVMQVVTGVLWGPLMTGGGSRAMPEQQQDAQRRLSEQLYSPSHPSSDIFDIGKQWSSRTNVDQSAEENPVVRVDLSKLRSCKKFKDIIVFSGLEPHSAGLVRGVIYGHRDTILKLTTRGYVEFRECALQLKSLNEFLRSFPIEPSTSTYAGLGSERIILYLPSEGFARLAADVMSAPSVPPPPPPPLGPPPPHGSSLAVVDTAFDAKGMRNQCHWDKYCLTADRNAKLSIKCGDITVEASAEGAKVSVEKGPLEISFTLGFGHVR